MVDSVAPVAVSSEVPPPVSSIAPLAQPPSSGIVPEPNQGTDHNHGAPNESEAPTALKTTGSSPNDAGETGGAGARGVNPVKDDPVPIYRQALTQLTDMTADMAANFEQIKWVDNRMVVTLVDAYNMKMCSKPDRKAKIESAVGAIAGRAIRIDFIASKKQPAVSKKTKPKLSRVQQIRQLQEHVFVKEAIDLFDCEISDFYQR